MKSYGSKETHRIFGGTSSKITMFPQFGHLGEQLVG